MLRDLQTSPAELTVSGCRTIEILLIPYLARASDADSAVSHMSQTWSLCVPCRTSLLQWLAELQLKLLINLPHFLDPLTCALLVHGYRAEALRFSNSETEIPEAAFRGQRRIANDAFSAAASWSGILWFLYELWILIQSVDKVMMCAVHRLCFFKTRLWLVSATYF